MKVYDFESLFFDIGYCISVNLVVVYIILINFWRKLEWRFE